MSEVTLSRIGATCQVGDGTHSKIPRQPTGILYLTSRNFKDGGLDLSQVYYISEEDFAKHFLGNGKALARPEYGDLVFSIIGTIGEPYLVKEGDRFGLSSSVAIVRPDTDILNPKFLFYWFKGPTFQNALFGIKGGVAQGYVSLEMIRSLPVPKLSLELQRRIAGILSAYDDLIENNQRRIKILEEMARLLYREWFVRFRFPGHKKVPLVDSPLGKIPKGWTVKPVLDFGEVITGKTPSKANPDFYGEDIAFVKTPDMHGNTFILATGERLSIRGANSQATKNIPAGSLCVSCIGTIGVVSITTEICQTNQQINSVVLSNENTREFLFFRLQDAKDTLENLGSTGATMGNVNKAKFEAMRIVVPPNELLARYHFSVEPMFSAMLSLCQRIQNLRRTRDLLLPRLLSGSIRLEEAAAEPDATGIMATQSDEAPSPIGTRL